MSGKIDSKNVQGPQSSVQENGLIQEVYGEKNFRGRGHPRPKPPKINVSLNIANQRNRPCIPSNCVPITQCFLPFPRTCANRLYVCCLISRPVVDKLIEQMLPKNKQ